MVGDAREAWTIYYRAVRALRNLRREDREQFIRFSAAWWAGQYKYECQEIPQDMRARLNARKFRSLP